MNETTVLIVEDEEADRRQIKKQLEDALAGAVRLIFCETLRCARQEFASRVIDVVVLDLTLPDSNGLDPVEQIRGLSPDTPIVVCTEMDDPDTRLQSIASGALQFVAKNAGYGALPAAVVSGLEVRRRGMLAIRGFSERLQAIHTTIINTAGDVKTVKQSVQDLSHAVFGDGEPHKGLMHRVRENERFRNLSLKVSWLILGATITAAVGAVIAWVGGG